MPIGGRVPKPRDQVRHRNPARFDWIEVADVPFNGGPKLPRCRANGEPWPKEAVRLWNTWKRMPHAVLWRESDWQFALESVEVAARFYADSGCAAAVARELRDRGKVLGVTVDYLRALRIRYVDPGRPLVPVAGEQRGVADIADYRNLITWAELSGESRWSLRRPG
jgi:hypothetical protein